MPQVKEEGNNKCKCQTLVECKTETQLHQEIKLIQTTGWIRHKDIESKKCPS